MLDSPPPFAAGAGHAQHPTTEAADVDKPPTAKQLAYLKVLAERAGQTFATPRTSQDASAEIRRLKATPAESRARAEDRTQRDRRRDRRRTARQRPVHTGKRSTGYGINCRWSR